MSVKKTVFVAGATGAQGGATTNALLERGHSVIAITRNPNSDAAKALASRGVDVRTGDYADTDSIERAAAGADAAFAVTTSFEAGTDAEIEFGKTLVSALNDAGVGHIVFSSNIWYRWVCPTRSRDPFSSWRTCWHPGVCLR